MRTSRRFETKFPTLMSDLVSYDNNGDPDFPFVSWAASQGFKYPEKAQAFLKWTGSAAEAFFVRAFCHRPGFFIDSGLDRQGVSGGLGLELQMPIGRYRVDCVLSDVDFSLCIEIDGLSFHRMKAEQVAADYLRQRRLVLQGHTVIRFTADEAIHETAECWRQVDAIMKARRAP